MTEQNHDAGSKRVKNIAAVLYLLILTFVVGGSYLNQPVDAANTLQQPNNSVLPQP